jgi:(2R)-sulfolactate sulfo-lyase subunit alpha
MRLMPNQKSDQPSDTRDSRLLLLHADDNVFVVCEAIASGSELASGEDRLTLAQDVALGHKLARAPISKGDKVYKYGGPIGSATRDIAAGAHVHVHNLQSDYVAFHGHNAEGE